LSENHTAPVALSTSPRDGFGVHVEHDGSTMNREKQSTVNAAYTVPVAIGT
jgi:hypothetical protein